MFVDKVVIFSQKGLFLNENLHFSTRNKKVIHVKNRILKFFKRAFCLELSTKKPDYFANFP